MEAAAGVAGQVHQFYAVAFVENLSLRQLVEAFPKARVSAHELHQSLTPQGGFFIYPFGAVVTYDLTAEQRESALARLHRARPGLTTQVVREEYTVVEDPARNIGIHNGMLQVDRFTIGRAGVVALTVAQSAAMEYYEGLIEQLFSRTRSLVERLATQGSVPFRTRPLHRFIGEAISTRAEVLSVLHLLDKPDATWDDPGMDRIYDDLRGEFDLVDRYTALEMKLRSVQEALELVLDVARDRRLLILELAITLLICLELAINILQLKG
ncbi:MAG TPA: RMD1 family protein [Candidatus Binataceae bacterium]|nr:RMD1 family protein [Candidatus Binataceae bacterium]